jgi:RimJ/RimL family protein N-acetyltransferase
VGAVSPTALETQRLVLEPYTEAHAAQILDYYVRNRAHLEPWEPIRAPQFSTLDFHRDEAQRPSALGGVTSTCALRRSHATTARSSRSSISGTSAAA